jgi:hypothetical protein
MALRRADRIPPTDHRAGAGVLTLKQSVVTANAGVLLPAVDISATARLLDTEAVLTGVEEGALAGILTLGKAGPAHADLIV